MVTKKQAIDLIGQRAQELTALSDGIWDHPEVKYHEKFASETLSSFLRENGFRVTLGVAGIPTAFVAEYGSGHPVIGVLGEYDALERMSQKAECTQREPIAAGAPGHGCGHNLLGVGMVGAALAVKAYLESGREGTIKFFGCPAEEGGSGKTFMARDGVFDGVDAALTWHPADTNMVSNSSNLANCQIRYRFKGKSAHAAISPELGRSALDAMELMNVGVQFLREHMPSECRVHYAITDVGGGSPNVVQADAEVLYLIRAPKLPQVNDLTERVNNIARGAALMTGTQVAIHFVKACSNVLPNNVLGWQLQKNFEELGSAEYDAADYALAERMQAVMEDKDEYYRELVQAIPDDEVRQRLMADVDKPLFTQILPYDPHDSVSMASSDVGDVSWICPTSQITATTMPGCTVMHSWQEVAVGKSAMAHKGMLQAARVIAATAIDLLEDPSIIERAQAEKARRTGNLPYHCPIPDGVPIPM